LKKPAQTRAFFRLEFAPLHTETIVTPAQCLRRGTARYCSCVECSTNFQTEVIMKKTLAALALACSSIAAPAAFAGVDVFVELGMPRPVVVAPPSPVVYYHRVEPRWHEHFYRHRSHYERHGHAHRHGWR
jgi:hypothetical protein